MGSPALNRDATSWSETALRNLIEQQVGPHRIPRQIRIVKDSSNFFSVDYDDILLLDHIPYLVRNPEREGRFGLDDEVKLWVRRAIDLTTGQTKIVKMVFQEQYESRIGGLTFQCARSPRKEARILELVAGHPNFMQGRTVADAAGNLVRIIDYIRGKTLADRIVADRIPHEEYFYSRFTTFLKEFITLVEAIRFLHDHEEKHGDIRRDHVLHDNATGVYRWIDYDFNFYHRENMYGFDLFGLGNMLLYIVGQGDVLTRDLRNERPEAFSRLNSEDMNIVFPNRVMNLKKVYGYIPENLNRVLMHFSPGAEIFYEDTADLLHDILEVRDTLDFIKADQDTGG